MSTVEFNPNPLSSVPSLPPAAGEAQSTPAFSAEFRDFYAAHFSLVWRGLLRLGVPDTSIEDATQDVFLVVHRRETSFERRSTVETWLYGIVIRVAKDYRRTAARQKRRLAAVERASQAAPLAPTPVDQLERNDALRLVNQVLSHMNDAEREVLVLVELCGLSTQDAARALGTSLRTSQRQLNRARAAFDQLLSHLTTVKP